MPETVVAGLAALVALSGLVVAAVVGAATRSLAAAAAVALDLFLAAGLLRLAAADTWAAIGTAAGLVVVRKVASTGLRQGRATAPATGRLSG